jgi:hypothetical protein
MHALFEALTNPAVPPVHRALLVMVGLWERAMLAGSVYLVLLLLPLTR